MSADDEETPRPFERPLPPLYPPLPDPHDVLFLRSLDEEGGPEPREHEDIMLRRVPRATAMRFRAAAGGRGLTHAQYLTALVELHGRIRALADEGDERLRAELDARGLQTVSV